MYVFGGYEEIIERFGQDVYRLDLSTYTWKLLVSPPPPHTPDPTLVLAVLCGGATCPQGFPHSHSYRAADGYIWW